jgi:hypothetical protein
MILLPINPIMCRLLFMRWMLAIPECHRQMSMCA